MAVYRIHDGSIWSSSEKSVLSIKWAHQLRIMIDHFEGLPKEILKKTFLSWIDSIILDKSSSTDIRNQFIKEKAILFPESIMYLMRANRKRRLLFIFGQRVFIAANRRIKYYIKRPFR